MASKRARSSSPVKASAPTPTPPGSKPPRKRGKRSRRKRGSRRHVEPPRVPRSFICHICHRNHWTIHCPRLRDRPEDFPLLDRERGCWKCGHRGHAAATCTIQKYHCKQCGGYHDTKDCYFDHVSEEWHEFFDPVSQHVFYASSANPSERRWLPPTHERDEVLWYCAPCSLLIPSKYMECLKCHVARPVTVEKDATASDDDDDDDDDDNDDSTSSSGSESGSDSDSETKSSDE